MGRDKALLTVGGVPLLRRVLDTLLSAVALDVVIVAAEAQALDEFDAPRVKILRDPTPYEGPLDALARGLEQVRTHHGDVPCFVAATDLVTLHVSVVRRVLTLLADADAAVPMIGKYPQPLAAAYCARIAPRVNATIQSGERSLRGLLSSLDVRWIQPQDLLADESVQTHDPRLRSFDDADTPSQLPA